MSDQKPETKVFHLFRDRERFHADISGFVLFDTESFLVGVGCGG